MYTTQYTMQLYLQSRFKLKCFSPMIYCSTAIEYMYVFIRAMVTQYVGTFVRTSGSLHYTAKSPEQLWNMLRILLRHFT